MKPLLGFILEELDTKDVSNKLDKSINGLESILIDLTDIKLKSAENVRIGDLDDNIDMLEKLISNLKDVKLKSDEVVDQNV